eukprot:gene486-biopygen2134
MRPFYAETVVPLPVLSKSNQGFPSPPAALLVLTVLVVTMALRGIPALRWGVGPAPAAQQQSAATVN